MKKTLPIVIVLVLVAAIFIGIGISRKGKQGGQRSIAVIPKGITHMFWQSIRRGADKAGAEAGIKIYWNGPEREGNREKQIQIIEDFITQKVSGIVLAPIDNKALVPSVEKIHAKKIPCVIIDSGIETDKYVSFVATDNYKGGVIAARRMGKILNGKGKIVVVKYAPGSASTMKREDGFINTIEKEFPEIEIVDTKYGMDTVETSLQAAEDLLTKNAELDGLFACNESTSVGALRALQSQGRAGKMKMIGFDAGGLLIEGVKTGVVDSLVVQNPYKMGYTGVQALIATLDGKKVEKRVDTGVVLVTKENLETEEIKELLKGMHQ
ncbi:MAG: substrate-binding domain-containing protein [Phycisphaerae bacterium]|nr:ABC transporter substrate-binding protein [Phycisphaerae bacterium]NIS52088.1 ABC transporter substrate-binding protein [Phycisphaerae bacterium]NIU10719.1 ABC transporter substrate-binding protein [Phycisphaerae bacterium]NIU55898.1 substrate-binding domain-containing protein [Phycisphaerae bacterium]NIV00313.1 substrate-binding domain-containing protein [Phycisphaerae bacterium]